MDFKFIVWKYVRVVRTPVLRLLYRAANAVVPSKEKRIVFMSQPDAADSSWHLYRYMATHLHGYEFIWLCYGDPSIVRERLLSQCEKKSLNIVHIVRRRSIRGLYLFLSSSYVFSSHGTYGFVAPMRAPVLVNLWHGMPIKVIGRLDDSVSSLVTPCDYALSTSELFTEVIAKVFDIPKSNVLEFGLPRNDVLTNDAKCEPKKTSIRQKLGVSEDRTLVFWLPTYRQGRVHHNRSDSKHGSFLDEWDRGMLSRLNSLAEQSNRYVVIKLHPLDRLNQECPATQFDHLKIVSTIQWQNLAVDLYDALADSSALISDVSSVIIDYIATGNPIGVTARSTEHYTRGLIPSVKPCLEACHRIYNEEDLAQFVSKPECDKINRKALLNYNCADNTGSCRNIVEYFGFIT